MLSYKNAIQLESRAGYFAVLYNKMTINVQQVIFDGEFKNNDRMKRLIENFANLCPRVKNGFTKKKITALLMPVRPPGPML